MDYFLLSYSPPSAPADLTLLVYLGFLNAFFFRGRSGPSPVAGLPRARVHNQGVHAFGECRILPAPYSTLLSGSTHCYLLMWNWLV